MKLDLKGILAICVVFGVVAVASYMMGVSQGEKGVQGGKTPLPIESTSAEQSDSAFANTGNTLPAAHPQVTPATSAHILKNQNQIVEKTLMPDEKPKSKFSHFRVGNRNVKGMLADDKLVWVGTSGGVIRYELETDNYRLFDVSTGSLLSNGIFHLSKLGDKIAVGTYGGGLSIYDPINDKWKNYNIPDGLADQFVYSVRSSDGRPYLHQSKHRWRNGQYAAPCLQPP